MIECKQVETFNQVLSTATVMALHNNHIVQLGAEPP